MDRTLKIAVVDESDHKRVLAFLKDLGEPVSSLLLVWGPLWKTVTFRNGDWRLTGNRDLKPKGEMIDYDKLVRNTFLTGVSGLLQFPKEGSCCTITPELITYLKNRPGAINNMRTGAETAKGIAWNETGFWYFSGSTTKPEYSYDALLPLIKTKRTNTPIKVGDYIRVLSTGCNFNSSKDGRSLKANAIYKITSLEQYSGDLNAILDDNFKFRLATRGIYHDIPKSDHVHNVACYEIVNNPYKEPYEGFHINEGDWLYILHDGGSTQDITTRGSIVQIKTIENTIKYINAIFTNGNRYRLASATSKGVIKYHIKAFEHYSIYFRKATSAEILSQTSLSKISDGKMDSYDDFSVGDTVTVKSRPENWCTTTGGLYPLSMSNDKKIQYPFTGVIENIQRAKHDTELIGIRISGYGFTLVSDNNIGLLQTNNIQFVSRNNPFPVELVQEQLNSLKPKSVMIKQVVPRNKPDNIFIVEGPKPIRLERSIPQPKKIKSIHIKINNLKIN